MVYLSLNGAASAARRIFTAAAAVAGEMSGAVFTVKCDSVGVRLQLGGAAGRVKNDCVPWVYPGA
jgi:hypothetical protein